MSNADRLDNDARLQSCEIQFRQFGGFREFAGRIRTVKCFEDTLLVKELLNEQSNGEVLVIDGAGSWRSALMGDRTALTAVENGWAGLVINGVVRDSRELRSLSIGIKALGTNPRKPGQTGAGEINVPVSFGSVTFWPGAELWSDEDGIVTTGHPSVASSERMQGAMT